LFHHFATNLTLPVDAVAVEIDSATDKDNSVRTETANDEDYQFAMLMNACNLFHAEEEVAIAEPALIMVTDPQGRVVSDAQVVANLIDTANGSQIMVRAWPYRSGYLVPTQNLSYGRYLVETEIVTNGRFLSKLFSLEIS